MIAAIAGLGTADRWRLAALLEAVVEKSGMSGTAPVMLAHEPGDVIRLSRRRARR